MSSAAAISGPRPDASFAARLDATAAEIERLLDRLLPAHFVAARRA
jgi:hypothetical protein